MKTSRFLKNLILPAAVLALATTALNSNRVAMLMIGMVAFIVEVPAGVLDPSTVLPVQVFLWSDLPEIAFKSKTAAAIMVLLVVLFALNAVAIYLRKRFDRRW